MPIDWTQQRVLVTGGQGFLGRVVCRALEERGCRLIFAPTKGMVNLTDFEATLVEMDGVRPHIVFHLAGEVGGIGANQAQPGRFFYANMAMGLNVIEAARQVGVKKFVQVGTACSYPQNIPLPFQEWHLWCGYPEATNAPYGIAKRALATMLQAYREEYDFDGVYVILANLYGPGDNFDPETSHVIPALIRKFDEAKRKGHDIVTCWGTGQVTREFLYVDDAAEALLLAAETLSHSRPVNIGSGHEISIGRLAEKIRDLVEFEGGFAWDTSRPDGQSRRRLNCERAIDQLGWSPRVNLDTGLTRTIHWWQQQHA